MTGARDAGGMTALTNEIVIDAPAGAVWRVIAFEFDRIGDWATAIPASKTHAAVGFPTVDAPVTGRICHTGLRLVPEVTETIVGYDEAAMTLTYEATGGLPSFVTLARNRWQVTAIAGDRARVSFQAQLRVRGLGGWLFRWWLLRRVGRDGRHLLDDLNHYVTQGTPSPRKQRAGPR
jgi:Polyketide cyclase / dehydrase and lipid transport